MGSFHLITVVPPLGAQLLGQCLVANQVSLGCLHKLPNTVITSNTGQPMVVRCDDYHQGHCVSVLPLVMLHYYPGNQHVLIGTHPGWVCNQKHTANSAGLAMHKV